MTIIADKILNQNELDLLLLCIDSSDQQDSNEDKQQLLEAYLMLKGE